ncbi:MAG: transposase [Bacillota bacterium]
MNIKQMYENGVAISEIARRTGRDRKTIRKWIQSDGPPKKVQRRRPGKLDEYKEYHSRCINKNLICQCLKNRKN